MGEEKVAVGPLAFGHEQAHVEIHVLVPVDEVQRIELKQRIEQKNGEQDREGKMRAQPGQGG
jgi:hypothetical protein